MTEEEDHDNEEEQEEEEEEETHLNIDDNIDRNVWSKDPRTKDRIIKDLIKCFSSMVRSSPMEYAVADRRGRYKQEDLIYTKLLDASKYIIKAKRALLRYENFETRDFTIFIANKKWARDILRPLLELCAKDDSALAMRICGFALFLVKRINEKTAKTLKADTRRVKKSTVDLTAKDPEAEDGSGIDEQPLSESRELNAKEQIAALLTFKEAFCSEKCSEALTNAFKEFWQREQDETEERHSEENKTGVAICFSFIRRVLAIEAHPNWSTVGEQTLCRSVQDRYIVQLRQVLGVIPSICGDLGNTYHNDWVADIILIIYFAIKHVEVRHMLLVWRSGALIDHFEDLESEASTADKNGEKDGKRQVKGVQVPDLLKKAAQESRGGSLKDLLSQQRRSLVAGGTAGVVNSRYNGVYRAPVQNVPIVRNGDESPTKLAQSSQQLGRIFSNPFGASESSVPQVKTKNSKKNLTFMQDKANPLAEQSIGGACSDDDSRKACVVVATLVNLLSDELSLKPLIKRVNEDRRRDDGLISPDMELHYFEVVTKLLQFNRLKLADQFAQLAKSRAAQGGSSESALRWEPNLKNVMDALDRMSFSRVLAAISEMGGKNTGRRDPADLYIPVTLYKEMVCYLRVLLESDIEGHHDIAIAAMYRLFYTPSVSERQDPLTKLLIAWRPGAFSRTHLNVLVELVHETLKTLDTARNRFQKQRDALSAEDKKKLAKKTKGKKDVDLEQYALACMRFEVDEYFKRLASNNCVRMYTKLLSNYASNDQAVNHYSFIFLQRMCAYKLEQDYRVPMPPSPNSVAPSGAEEEVHLGYMLFNIQTLQVFSDILNDPDVCRQATRFKHLEPLVRLIRSLVRRFGEATRKNRMLFVELLFQHARPDSFCCLLDNVYQASSYAVTNASAVKKKGLHVSREGGSASENSGSSSSEESDYGDEFDENNVSAAFQRSSKPEISEKKAKKQAKRADKEPRVREQKREKRNAWSAEEDDALRALYLVYAGSASIFTSIANSDELRNRSEAQVQKRVKELGLGVEFESEEEDNIGLGFSFGHSDDDVPSASKRQAEEQDTYPQDAEISTQPQIGSVMDSLASPQSDAQRKKKARLRTEDNDRVSSSLPRAIWDNDDDVDILEQRSLGLVGLGDGSASKKHIRRSVGAEKRRQQSSSDSDDDLFAAEEQSQEVAPEASQSRKGAKARQMMVQSDDEDD